jgi:Xaa-Pro aminopeptidase
VDCPERWVSSRIDRLRARLPNGCNAFLVTNGVNVRYLSGFASSNAVLLIDAERTRLLTDGRYLAAAQRVPGVEVTEAARDLAADLRDRLPSLLSGPVAFEADDLTVARHATIAASGVELVATRGVVESVRAVKEPVELDAIRRAASLLTASLEQLTADRVVGRSEQELAWSLERTMRELGADGVGFEPIVASGPNAALPHHHPGSRIVETDETFLVDAGCLLDGYRSDCTRTFATGALPPELRRAYDVCLEAQQRSLSAVLPGASCRDVDAVAREIVADAGYPVAHGLGHGVGLDIHEEPRLTDTATCVLEVGNVVTVEPGVYLPGVGGIRIEDLVIVGADGPEVLTSFPKELQILA